MQDYQWTSELFIRSNSETAIKKLNEYFEENSLSLEAGLPHYDNTITCIWNGDCEEDGDDDTLKDLYKFVKSMGLVLEGYYLYDCEGTHWRCEFTKTGKIKCADMDWLTLYSVDEIRKLQKYAAKEFKK